MQPSSSSSHYVPSGGYDDLRLPPIRLPPPIRNATSSSSTYSPYSSSKHVRTMEPPTFPSSVPHPRQPSNVTLPPIKHFADFERPRTSLGHSSHTFGSSSSAPLAPPRHASHSSHANTPPFPLSHRPPPRPSSSSHHSSSSFPFSPSDYKPPYPMDSQPNPTFHHSSEYPDSHDPNLHVSPRAFTCDLCGAAFSRAYDCKRHRDIHTRQGGHECPSCHKSLSRADALKRHKERGCSGTGMEEEDPDEIERESKERRRQKSQRHGWSGTGIKEEDPDENERERQRDSKERRRQKSQSISDPKYYTSSTRPR